MKFLDLFAGIGGFRLGMEEAGHECVGFCEKDKFARKSYKAIHDTEGEVEMHDITTVTDEFVRGIGSVDIICGGFPCQAFSIAGKRRGFEDTRGTLFFEIARFASILRPRYLFLENVKGLLNHEQGATFETILRTLDELGYDVEWDCINSAAYIPQNRERVFIIGHLRGAGTRKIFPFQRDEQPITELQRNANIANTITARYGAAGGSGSYIVESEQPKQIAIPVLTPERLVKRQNGRRFKNDGEEMFTLTSQDRHGVVIGGLYTDDSPDFHRGVLKGASRSIKANNHDAGILIKEANSQGYSEATPGDSVNVGHPNSKTRRGRVGKKVANAIITSQEQAVVTEELSIRKLTPRECWRLQTFPDWAFDRAVAVNSDSQLYIEAGNSVTVAVVFDIARRFE